MSHYEHLSIDERESILKMRTLGKSIREISRELKRSVSTISRELSRNGSPKAHKYSANKAQEKYHIRRKRCHRKLLLSNERLRNKILNLFLQNQWSPEQIANRLALENKDKISFNTIYRAIHTGLMEEKGCYQTKGKFGLERKLRRKGKKPKPSSQDQKRGKFQISNPIEQRPLSATNRTRFGHWEADMVAGKKGAECLVTLVDRKSRFLLTKKCPKASAIDVQNAMVDLLAPFLNGKLRSVTPGRGKEFSNHLKTSQLLNCVPFYFPKPYSPWERGTNENTNGLIREYMPKYTCMSLFSDDVVESFVNKLNYRPRKCLGWKSPFEVFFQTLLHLT